jgi:hypothetical protein
MDSISITGLALAIEVAGGADVVCGVCNRFKIFNLKFIRKLNKRW